VRLPEEAGIGAVPRPGDFGAEPVRVVPGGDQQQQCSGLRADAVESEQPGGAGGDERADQLVQALHLAIQELCAAPELAQRDPDGIGGRVAGPGPQ
jgi:hypothetical protein